jgi:CheY-like chemotaxis protein
VEEAGSGEEALVAIHRTAPQLVILDLLLPGIDGFTVLDTLRTREATAQVPVLVVTGKTLTSAEKEQLTRGMVRVLTKEEYSRERFLTLIREVWGTPGVRGPKSER